MDTKNAIAQKYIELAGKFGVSLKISNVSGDHFPVQQITETEDGAEIQLNTAMICEAEYEDHLSYNVRKLILPKLCLETDRLVIRRYKDCDAEHLFEFLNDRDSCYSDGGYEPYDSMNEEYYELMDTFKNGENRYIIALKENDEAVGMINLMPCDDRAVEANEIGYIMNPGKRRQGYAFEAVSGFTGFLLNDLHLDMVTAGAIEDNVPSLNMLEKLGFVFEGKRHKALYHPVKGPVDLLCYYKDRENIL